MPEQRLWLVDARLLGETDELPRVPRGYIAQQLGMTAHLARAGVVDKMACGALVHGTTPPKGRALAWCGTCWAIAQQ